MNSISDRAARGILAAVMFVCFLPFLGKAFHIDEPLFLWTAEQIQRHPLDFFGFSVNWEGYLKPMAAVTQNPPFAAFYLSLLASMFGWNEWPLHLGFLLTGIAAAWGTFRLARDMGCSPLLALAAALATSCTPAFFLSAASLMCDMLMVAAWVWAVVWWRRAVIHNDRRWYLLSAVAISVACLTKFFAVALIPLLLVYTVARQQRAGSWLAFFLLPLTALGAYQLYTRSLYGHGMVTNAATYAAAFNLRGGVLAKTFTDLVFTGGCLASFPLSLPFVSGKRGTLLALAATLLLFAVLLGTRGAAFATTLSPVTPGYAFQAALMAVGGGSILALAATTAWQRRDADSLLLLCWILGTFFFTGYLNWTVSGRNLLPMAPAVGLLLALRLQRLQAAQTPSGVYRWAVWALGPALALSVAVAWSDYRHAETARQAAGDIGKLLAGKSAQAWFRGHWGFQYYMQRQGMKPFDQLNTTVSPGDYVVVADNNGNNEPLPNIRVAPAQRYRYPAACCLSTMNIRSGAGFYSHYWGTIPYLFGTAPMEEYQVYQAR